MVKIKGVKLSGRKEMLGAEGASRGWPDIMLHEMSEGLLTGSEMFRTPCLTSWLMATVVKNLHNYTMNGRDCGSEGCIQ